MADQITLAPTSLDRGRITRLMAEVDGTVARLAEGVATSKGPSTMAMRVGFLRERLDDLRNYLLS